MRPLRIGATMRYSALFVIDAMSPTPSLYQHRGKRLFDLLIALPVLLVFGPTLAVLAVLVSVKLGTPIFFRQLRPGLHGKPFTMVKFRTMTDARDASGALLPDADRLTRFGKFLRATSLDELPELWNVVKGEMSLAGPRPRLMHYPSLVTPEQVRGNGRMRAAGR